MARTNSTPKRPSGTAHADHPGTHGTKRMTGGATRAAKSKPTSKGEKGAKPARGKHVEKDRRAVLAAATGESADRMEVEYSQGQVVLSFAVGERPVFAGAWEAELQMADGSAIPAKGAWESVCWHSDSDGDYLELQLQPAEGLRIDRMLFVSRDGEFALLADAVISESGAPAVVNYTTTIPLAAQLTADISTETRERVLKAKGMSARLFPLGLGSDPADGSGGSLEIHGDTLKLEQSIVGGNVWVPLLIDWNSSRAKKPAVWRRLTVSESRVVIGPHQASAARWQCGGEHLLCYRALTTPELARAVLGLHTWYETVVARIPKPGTYTSLVQIEQAAGE